VSKEQLLKEDGSSSSNNSSSSSSNTLLAAAQACFYRDAPENARAINASSLDWVLNFAEQSSYPRATYFPHVTLGLASDAAVDAVQADAALSAPVDFRARRIGVYQLGNFCTCRRPLVEFDL
jgi:hypothetical protein